MTRFGVALPSKAIGVTRQDLAGFVDRAERLGLDSVWALDRLVRSGLTPLPLLSRVLGRTERVRVGTCVLIAPLYNPLVLAKEVATMDMLSGGGRIVLGLGSGPREDDLQAALHLPRGLVRERDREDLVRLDPAGGDEVRDAVREDARLPRPRARDDEDGPLGREHRLALGRVQVGQVLLRGGRRHGVDRIRRAPRPGHHVPGSHVRGLTPLRPAATCPRGRRSAAAITVPMRP